MTTQTVEQVLVSALDAVTPARLEALIAAGQSLFGLMDADMQLILVDYCKGRRRELGLLQPYLAAWRLRSHRPELASILMRRDGQRWFKQELDTLRAKVREAA